MVGFCGCFSAPQVQYREQSSSSGVQRPAALTSPEDAEKVPAPGVALPVYKPAVVKPPAALRASAPELGSLPHRSNQQQQLLTPAAPDAAAAVDNTLPAGGSKLVSHRINISPAAELRLCTPDSTAGADAMPQDNTDTPRKTRPAAASFHDLLEKQAAAAEDSWASAAQQPVELSSAADSAACADAAARHSKQAAADSRTKVPSGSGSAKAMKTPPSNRKSSAGSVRTPLLHTPRGKVMPPSPSPAVARPTCASMSRAQAVAASMPTPSGAGHWKL
uniref:Uncharacterized protein n=1 Tax=Tetradesmus obliquus TaxID=3088 RepID=A0A383VPN3_TETOB|eukprot:jgi/Sobl393_1/16023/SZX66843.1